MMNSEIENWHMLSKYIWVVGLIVIIGIGCSSQEGDRSQTSGDSGQAEQAPSENPVATVNSLIKNDQYEEALSRLEQAGGMADSTRQRLQEKTHLNYGLYLEYRGGDRSMRDRMTNALRQFIEVLHINRENQKALAEIKQIMGIYGTMPDKSPPSDIKKELNALGVKY